MKKILMAVVILVSFVGIAILAKNPEVTNAWDAKWYFCQAEKKSTGEQYCSQAALFNTEDDAKTFCALFGEKYDLMQNFLRGPFDSQLEALNRRFNGKTSNCCGYKCDQFK